MKAVMVVLCGAISLSFIGIGGGQDNAATPRPAAPPVSALASAPAEKIASPLLAVLGAASKAESPAKLSNPLVRVNDAGEVQVYVQTKDLSQATRDDLTAHGLRVEVVSDAQSTVQGWLPLGAVETVAGLPSVVKVTPPGYARSRGDVVKSPRLFTGSVVSQGVNILGADTVHVLGKTGVGVKVGVLATGAAHIAASRATGDLPATIQIDPAYPGDTSDGGTHLLEIIYDVAPGASLAFSGPATSSEFPNALNYLVNTIGCDVVIDNIGFYDEPYFEDGLVAQAVAAIVSSVVCVSAAGNDGVMHYQAAYVDINPSATGWPNDNHAFATSSQTLRITIPAQKAIAVLLQWNDRFGLSANNYDVFLYDRTANTILAGSNDVQNGNDNPYEGFTYTNSTASPMTANIVINRLSGASRTLELFVWDATALQYVTYADSIFGHPAVIGVLSVAAVNAATPNTCASYSSHGFSTIFFPSFVSRSTPRLAATDGVLVTGAGGSPVPPNLLYGTSAAAAHVAGIAALLMGSEPLLSAAQVRTRLEQTAWDLGTPGFDATYGWGRVNASRAIIPPSTAASHWELFR